MLIKIFLLAFPVINIDGSTNAEYYRAPSIAVVDMFLPIMFASHDIELNTSVAELCIIRIQLRVILNHQ